MIEQGVNIRGCIALPEELLVPSSRGPVDGRICYKLIVALSMYKAEAPLHTKRIDQSVLWSTPTRLPRCSRRSYLEAFTAHTQYPLLPFGEVHENVLLILIQL